MSTSAPVYVWPTLGLRDARTAVDFLERAFGFEVTAAYWDDRDPSHLNHAELRYPPGGGIMCGSSPETGDGPRQPGTAAVYIQCDDPDALFARAVEAGATVVQEPHDVEYAENSRAFAVRDPEGNTWSFGQYAGE
jgi:uncharacterized glyoxalase superfamily protein PhnB